jgi:DNA adenine methylase
MHYQNPQKTKPDGAIYQGVSTGYARYLDKKSLSNQALALHNRVIEPRSHADPGYAMHISPQQNPLAGVEDHRQLQLKVVPPPEQHARPFLKWVGGKTQLIKHIEEKLPPLLKTGDLLYAEPFLGGGSVFFHVAQKYSAKRFIISDNNRDLIWAYKMVQNFVEPLMEMLGEMQSTFWALSTEARSAMYYQTREVFNQERHELTEQPDFRIRRTAQMIFLNKTCFNGLYRVNSNGGFNVAFGKYDKPPICDKTNLVSCSRILRGVDVILCDFEQIREMMGLDSFVYLDPPYRPISETSNFTSYSSSTFNAADQDRLAKFCLDLHRKGSRLMISNSDPKNLNPADRYFENTYPDFNITTLSANRMVNCKADRRGKISELLITNY